MSPSLTSICRDLWQQPNPGFMTKRARRWDYSTDACHIFVSSLDTPVGLKYEPLAILHLTFYNKKTSVTNKCRAYLGACSTAIAWILYLCILSCAHLSCSSIFNMFNISLIENLIHYKRSNWFDNTAPTSVD